MGRRLPVAGRQRRDGTGAGRPRRAWPARARHRLWHRWVCVVHRVRVGAGRGGRHRCGAGGGGEGVGGRRASGPCRPALVRGRRAGAAAVRRQSFRCRVQQGRDRAHPRQAHARAGDLSRTGSGRSVRGQRLDGGQRWPAVGGDAALRAGRGPRFRPGLTRPLLRRATSSRVRANLVSRSHSLATRAHTSRTGAARWPVAPQPGGIGRQGVPRPRSAGVAGAVRRARLRRVGRRS